MIEMPQDSFRLYFRDVCGAFDEELFKILVERIKVINLVQ